jgi:cell division transport system ATP-binding protein
MIEFYHVNKTFKPNWPVLQDINLKIGTGEFVVITGLSGSGKSTLLHLIYMNEFPASGQVVVDGMNSLTIKRRQIAKIRRRMGMIFQEFHLLEDRSVYENVELPLLLTGCPQAEIKKRVLKVMAYTGLAHRMYERPAFLSGGEKQRVCIARAIVNNPLVLLADEPTGSLDPVHSAEILTLLKNIHNGGTAVVVATHNPELLRKLSGRRVTLDQGKIIEDRAAA